jgi:hypothetical protein
VDYKQHLHRVTSVAVIGHHLLRLTFEDGLSGVLDAASWEWRGMFVPLRDQEYFARVALDEQLGTITWPNGADIAPETLHLWVSELRDRQPA